MSKPKSICPLAQECADGAFVCPLSHVGAGSDVRIKRLQCPPEVMTRLREMGLREQQKVKLLMRQSSFICQVCNARLGLSPELADSIIVEPVEVDRSKD